jgi:hypothetical protein
MPADAAFAEVEKGRGLQFDPDFAAAFLAIRERIQQEIRNQGGTEIRAHQHNEHQKPD